MTADLEKLAGVIALYDAAVEASRKLRAADKAHRGADWLAVTQPLTGARNAAWESFEMALLTNCAEIAAALREVSALREALGDAELSAGAVHAMRRAARIATGGNCTFVDDDAMTTVTLLMKVAEMHGIDLAPAVQRARAALATGEKP